MTHPLIQKVSAAIDGGYETHNGTSYRDRVDGYSKRAIAVVLDDLIACSEFRQQANERRGDTAGAQHWAMERAWLVNRKEEVLS
jgi:hypothetical protein